METTFDEWLRQLGTAGKGPVTLPAAVRGEPWSRPIELEGDWTGSALAGSIRVAPDSATVLASFTVTGPVVAAGFTTFTLSLSGAQTGGLPDDSDGDGVEPFPFMLRFTPSGEPEELLFGGILPVLGAV